MQLEMGMSTMRYLPASGTAGLARSLVRGKRRVPWPPPMMTQRTLLIFSDCRPVCDIGCLVWRDITADGRGGQAAVCLNSRPAPAAAGVETLKRARITLHRIQIQPR